MNAKLKNQPEVQLVDTEGKALVAEPAKSQVPAAQNPMLAMMERLAMNPDLPVEKLEKLLDTQFRIRGEEAERSFADAMARVQQKLPIVTRDRKNDQTNSRYARLEAIAKAIKPIYTEEGFSITFTEAESSKEDHIRIVGTLRHRDGHSETGHVDVAVDKVGIKGNDNKTLTHAEGSSFSYGRRYLTCLMFDVATGDDNDGNGADVKVITDAQVQILSKLIEESGADKGRFLEAIGVASLDRLPANAFNAAKAALKAKRAAKPKTEAQQ